MTYKICYWDEIEKCQKERDATPEERAEIDNRKLYVDPFAYRLLRATEYPPMSDYLDGIVKGDQVQVQAYIDACLAIKAKYPKG
jgi:hypothetical protein